MVQLNKEQQRAVGLIEGPVLVIAGAGTGKTQVIAHRIANILKNTQTPPSSILCLTFTESAAQNMRDRLLSIIGSPAYSVRISTFHAFCNDIILSRPELFVFAPNITPVDELEKIEIIQDLIEALPHEASLKPWGDHLFYQRDIISSLQTLKRENITPDNYQQLLDDEHKFLDVTKDIYDTLKSLKIGKTLDTDIEKIITELKNLHISPSLSSLITYHCSLFTTGGYTVGVAKNPAINFKNALIKIIDNLKTDIIKQTELLTLYIGYQSELQKRGLYDYDDMIIQVLNALRNYPDFLLELQEKFQYFLIDEFQDTNSSQYEIIRLLGSYYDRPNIFVVGDDDQSIFRFQGASVANIFTFYQTYHPEVVVLRNNYRSHQLILDSSNSVISRNQNRIAVFIKDIDKSLLSADTLDHDPINLIAAPTPESEDFLVAQKIENLIKRGVPPKNIAVLYRHNSDIDSLLECLDNSGIKYFLPVNQNILDSPHIRQLISLLQYIADPARTDLQYPILASEFVGIPPRDLLRRPLLDPTLSGLKKITVAKYKNFHIRLALARKWLENYPLDRFFNKVIRRFKFLDYCLRSDNPQKIYYLTVFYNELKRLQTEKKFTLTQFLRRLQSLQDQNVALTAPALTADVDSSVQLLTVHKAKGLEFDHVFLYKVADKKWGNAANRNRLRLPYGIISHEILANIAENNEEERRLYYVGLTRARQQIYISYTGLPSQFISEIDPKLIEKVKLPSDVEHLSCRELFPLKQLSEFRSEEFSLYLKKILSTEYLFNVTHLNAYLRCPLCFYYRTIIRVPAAKDKFSSFGTAIHAALAEAYTKTQDIDQILNKFEMVLKNESLSARDFDESRLRGLGSLRDYLNFYHIAPSPDYLAETDFRPRGIYLDNIHLTGKIDLIHKLDHNTVDVYDFKTGNPDSKGPDLRQDGDYFRQLVFYNLLLSLDSRFNFKIRHSIIDFIQKSRQKNILVRKEFEITPDHIEKLKTDIRDVYQKIINLDFNHIGPECNDPYHLHYLLR